MPVRNKKSPLFRDPASPNAVPPDPSIARGRRVHVISTITNAADDTNGSTFHLADLPSDCILLEDTAFDVEAWGYAAVRVGTRTDNDALLSIARGAGVIGRPKAFGDANHGKMLWEQLGLSKDPGGVIGIYAHSIADPTAAGNMPFQFVYLTR